jgi:3-hydroxyisobutyrate dehydrogenase-like beta-hydroxyacid dehydrogenase
MQTVGVIGLGLLGSAIASRLLAAGLCVVGHDVRPECCERLCERGGIAPNNSRSVADSAETIILVLPDSQAVEQVVSEMQPIRPGTLIIDCTTGDPDKTSELGARLKDRSVRYVDATVAGSSSVVERGEAIVMMGGIDIDAQAAKYLTCHIAKQSFHVGPWGSGARMKLVVNLVLGLNRAVLAEGLSLARSLGLDPSLTLEILKAGPAYSKTIDGKGRKMIEHDFTPEAYLRQHHKDVRLILEAATNCGASTPLSVVHESLLSRAIELGFGEEDNCAIIRMFESK